MVCASWNACFINFFRRLVFPKCLTEQTTLSKCFAHQSNVRFPHLYDFANPVDTTLTPLTIMAQLSFGFRMRREPMRGRFGLLGNQDRQLILCLVLTCWGLTFFSFLACNRESLRTIWRGEAGDGGMEVEMRSGRADGKEGTRRESEGLT